MFHVKQIVLEVLGWGEWCEEGRMWGKRLMVQILGEDAVYSSVNRNRSLGVQ